ncbi:MAG TPA: hypothetical protein VFC42_01010 [Methylomirabilota bacterium]|nr:hypothetical protein [Methylomirabilota bacterium]
MRQVCRSNSSTWTRLQNASISALATQDPTAPTDGSKPDSWARRVNAQEQNGVPWSPWITVDAVGSRRSIAIPKAFVTSAAVGAASIDQPTTRRENASSATAPYTLPSRVGCSVMSVTQSWSRCPRAASRVARSVAATWTDVLW